MASLFTRIVAGELPARFVWRDPDIVAFLTIAPLAPGHTLVVPRAEVESWTDADDELLSTSMSVAKRIGQALQQVWGAPRAGVVIAGFDVPHLHVHVFPAWTLADFDFHRVDTDPDPAELDANAARIRQALQAMGHPAEAAGP